MDRKFSLTPSPLARFDLKLDPANVNTDAAARTIMGYASVFGVLDSQGDIMMRGAFARTIEERRDKIRVLSQHNMDRPIGLPTVLREDDYGLYFEAEIADTPAGNEALAEIKAGLVTGVSVGFTIQKSTVFEDEELRAQLDGWAKYSQMRRLEEVKLYEFSPVTFAACEEAQILAVKSAYGWLPASSKAVLEGAQALSLPATTPPPEAPSAPDLTLSLDVAKGILTRFEDFEAKQLASQILARFTDATK